MEDATMKKAEYIAPRINVAKMTISSTILAGSTFDAEVKSENFDSESMTTLSRRGNSLWDDEDE